MIKQFYLKVNNIESNILSKIGFFFSSIIVVFSFSIIQYFFKLYDLIYFNPFFNWKDLLFNFIFINFFLFLFGSILASFFIFLLIHLINGIKFLILKQGILVGDLEALTELFYIFGIKYFFLFLFFSLIIISFIYILSNVIFFKKRFFFIIVYFFIFYIFFSNWKIDEKLFFNQTQHLDIARASDFKKSGLIFSLVQSIKQRSNINDKLNKEISNIKSNDKYKKFYLNSQNNLIPKNIYIILQESYTHIDKFHSINIDKKFLSDLNLYKKNLAISPVFGGMSAGAEFEIFCGNVEVFYFSTPTYNVMNKFPTNCITNFLHEKSNYDFHVSSASEKRFFNSSIVHKSLGVKEAFYREDLVKFINDFDGPNNISDEALYNFTLSNIKKNLKIKKPMIYLISTTAGHMPYDLNEQKRPIKYSDENKDLEKFINRIYYSTVELNYFIEEILKVDKNSIIIALPDHIAATSFTEKYFDNISNSYEFFRKHPLNNQSSADTIDIKKWNLKEYYKKKEDNDYASIFFLNNILRYLNHYIILVDGKSYQTQPIAYHEFPQLIINLLNNEKNFKFSENLVTVHGIIKSRNILNQDLKKTENLCLNSSSLIECKNFTKIIEKSINNIFQTLYFSRNLN